MKPSVEDHRCCQCHRWASFGSRNLATNERTWYCAKHLPDDYGLPRATVERLHALAIGKETFDDLFIEEFMAQQTANPALAAPGASSLDWEGL